MKEKHELKLLSQELKNPYKQLGYVFLLTSIIPVLACIFMLRDKLFTSEGSPSDLVPMLFFSALIIILGYIVGYRVVKTILNKILAYALRAKRADELKSTLASALAHDLKSPLAVIKTNQSNLKAGLLGTLNPQQEEAVDTSKRTADRMNFILTNLIDTYTLEAGKAEIKLSHFDLRELINEQQREMLSIANTKNVSLSVTTPKKALSLYADRTMILRVINNLLNNAIKYTASGGKVTMTATMADEFARMEILNTGEKIPPDMLEKIFNKFERLDKTIEGQGLGLAIARDIVEVHKGKIWAESNTGKPNCFTVLLPLTKN